MTSPELTTTCHTSFPEDHRVEESSSLRNYHPGFATGVVIPANFEEYQRKSDRIGEVIFSSAGNRCLNSDCIYPTGEDIKKALKQQRSQAAGSYFVLHSHEEDNIHIESKKRTHLIRIRT